MTTPAPSQRIGPYELTSLTGKLNRIDTVGAGHGTP